MDIHVNQNLAYYSQLPRETLCDCAYCKNYYRQIRTAYPEMAAYLQSFGIDIEKPFETSPLEPENGCLTYCACQYIVFGTCADHYFYKIGNTEFRKAVFCPDTGIAEPHFILEAGPITLKANF